MAEGKDKADSEKNSVDMKTEHSSSLTFDEKVIKKIAGYAASEIPGILAMSGNLLAGLTDMLRNSDDPTKGITVEVGKRQVAIDMKVVCEYGRNIPVVFQNLVDKVSEVVKEMTGLDVIEVNVHVYDVLTKEEFERQNKRRQEEKTEVKTEVKEEPSEEMPRRVE